MESAEKLKHEIRGLEREIQERSLRMQAGPMFNSPTFTPGEQEEGNRAALSPTLG